MPNQPDDLAVSVEPRNDGGASAKADRATHEPSRAVSALRVGIAGALALSLSACESHPQSVRERMLKQCIAMSRDSGASDMEGAIRACAEAAQKLGSSENGASK